MKVHFGFDHSSQGIHSGAQENSSTALLKAKPEQVLAQQCSRDG